MMIAEGTSTLYLIMKVLVAFSIIATSTSLLLSYLHKKNKNK
jgi:hypothetical protein